MKLLSLNVHSWMEIHPSEKLLHLAQAICAAQPDLVALQEVNQLNLQHAAPTQEPGTRHRQATPQADQATADQPAPLLAQPPAGFDNFAVLLCQLLRQLGQEYSQYWSPSHIGFERYDEGVALLVRTENAQVAPLEARTLVVADYPYTDVRRRVLQAVRLPQCWVVSGHFSWWYRDGAYLFQSEWDALQEFASAELNAGIPTIVAGDFNNPASVRAEGYDYMRGLGWNDTYAHAEHRYGENTIVEPIAGWEGTTGPRRIDLVMSNVPLQVTSHEVIFDGSHYPVVSDHYGLLVEFSLPKDPAV